MARPGRLTLENFEGGFDQVEFLEKLTHRQLAEAQREGEFNPGKLRELVEGAAEDLFRLKEDAEERKVRLREKCGSLEKKHKTDLHKHQRLCKELFNNFRQMDTKLSSVATTAVRIGERLETAHTQKLTAVQARDLVQYVQDFDTVDDESDKALPYNTHSQAFRHLMDMVASRKTRLQCADLVQKLKSSCSELQGYDNARDQIEKFCNDLENTILKQFYEASRDDSFDEMRECAETLEQLNASQACYKRYVGSRRMFLEHLPEPGGGAAGIAGLDTLYDDIVATLRYEGELIRKVFPSPDTVMAIFLERIFEQLVQAMFEMALMAAEAEGENRYLVVMVKAFERTRKFADDIRALQFGTQTQIDMLMDSVFSNLKSQYFSREKSNLEEIIVADVNMALQTIKKSLGAPGRRRRLNVADVLETESLGDKIKHSLMKGKKDQEEAAVESTESILQLETIVEVLQYHDAAMNRCIAISSEDERCEQLRELFVIMMQNVEAYLDCVLDVPLRPMLSHDGPAVPHTLISDFMEVVHFVNQIVHKLQQHYQVIFITKLQDSPNDLTICSNTKRNLMAMLEKRIMLGLNHCLNAFVSTFSAILSQEQKKGEFHCSDDSMFGSAPTAACDKVVSYMRTYYEIAVFCLDGKNLDSFLGGMTHGLYSTLIEHIRRFTYTSTGGLQLMRDLTAYHAIVGDFGVPNADEDFEVLRELSNIFVIAPENIRGLIDGGRLAKIKDVQSFVGLRADYRSANVARFLSDKRLGAMGELGRPASPGPA